MKAVATQSMNGVPGVMVLLSASLLFSALGSQQSISMCMHVTVYV